MTCSGEFWPGEHIELASQNVPSRSMVGIEIAKPLEPREAAHASTRRSDDMWRRRCRKWMGLEILAQSPPRTCRRHTNSFAEDLAVFVDGNLITAG